MSFLKKGKSLGLITSLAIAGVVGVGATDSYAFGEAPFSQTKNGYKITGSTSLTRSLQDGNYLYTAKGNSTENYVTGSITVQARIYNAATGAPIRSSSYVNDTTPRDGKVSASVNLITSSSADYAAKSYHSGNSGSTSIVGYSYDHMPN